MKKSILIVSLIYVSLPLIIKSVPGALDPTFGMGTGIVTTSIGTSSSAQSIAIQKDGKFVVAGVADVGVNNFAVARYNSDGSLDISFGSSGIVTTAIGTTARAEAVAIQADGKIIAVGSATMGNDNFALARYTIDGVLDPTFGTGGIVTTPISGGATDNAQAVALQADGKIIAAGRTASGGTSEFALVRYNIDGVLDTSFGTNGIVTTTIGTIAIAFAVTIQQDGKIIAAGQTVTGVIDFALARYNTNGTLDTSFGSNGIVITTGVSDTAFAVTIQQDGKILAAGNSDVAGNSDFCLVRYNIDGSLDTSFGTGGIVTTGIAGVNDAGRAVAIQHDGKIIVAGFAGGLVSTVFALVRYTIDGSLDTSFGTGGIVTTAIGTTARAAAVALQANGKIVAVGFATEGTDNFALARYLNDTLVITKEASAENPCPGQNITYTIRVSNFGGGGTVNEIFVSDVLPAEIIFKSAQTRGAESSFDTATGVWFIPRLCVGEQAQLKVKARVGQFAGNQIICNTAVTSYSSIDNITDSSLFDSLGISTTEIYSTTECVSTLPVLYENVNHIARRADCDLVDLNMNLCDLTEKINTLEVQQAINQALANKLLLKLDCVLGF